MSLGFCPARGKGSEARGQDGTGSSDLLARQHMVRTT